MAKIAQKPTRLTTADVLQNANRIWCYKMQTEFDALYKIGWDTNLKKLLFSNGFGLVWITQDVRDEEPFMKSVILRLTDIAKQINLE